MVNQNKGITKSLYRRGADDGLWFGIYLSVLLLACFNSIYSAISAFVGYGMVFAVPFLIFFFLKRSYRSDRCTTTFSGLWLHGICIFFFGSLLLALTAYIYLRFCNPGYMNDAINTAIELYSLYDNPESNETVALLHKIQNSHLLPTSGQIAVELIWFSVFSGSLLSMLISAIVRATVHCVTPPPTPQQ